MRVRSVSISVTKNFGNYESLKLGAEVELEPGEDPQDGYTRGMAEIAQQLEALGVTGPSA